MISCFAKGLTVDVRDNATPPPAGNLDARKTAPGVVRWFDLSKVPIQTGSNLNYAITPGTSSTPTWDTMMGGLKFTIPGLSGSNAAGAMYGNFSADFQTQFREGMTFYMQVGTRWNAALWSTVFLDLNGNKQAGVKLWDIVGGDQPSNNIWQYSSSDAKSVFQTYYQSRLVEMYGYHPVNGTNDGLFERIPGDFKLQNAMPSPFCLYTKASGVPGAIPGCFNIVPDTWMSWKTSFTLGPRIINYKGRATWTLARRRLWGAVFGQPSQLLIDFSPSTNGYYDYNAGDPALNLGIGKFYLMPYITNKSPTQSHPTCVAWYRDPIISTQDIADAI